MTSRRIYRESGKRSSRAATLIRWLINDAGMRAAVQRAAKAARAGGSYRFVLRVADPLEVAFDAPRFSRLADASAVPNKLMRERDPFLLGDNAHQVLFDFFRIGIPREIEPL